MYGPHFTQAALHKELYTLDTAKGRGPDHFNPFLFPILADFLAEPISALFDKSLQSEEVLQEWRKAIMCPIFKRRDLEDATNYHRII